MKNYRFQMVAGGLSALLLTGVTLPAVAATSSSEPSVLVMSQKLSNGELFIDYVNLPSKGYAVVYGADKDGKPLKEPLGHAELNAGDHRGIKIKLNSEPPKGAKVWVSLYTDRDGKAGFERGGDQPIWASGLPSENQITVQ